jgi:hypothetical protein
LELVLKTDADTRANDFDIGANFRTFGGSGFLKLMQAESRGQTSVDVSLIVTAQRSFGLRGLKNVKLTEAAKEQFAQNPQLAEQTYGTHFVSAVERAAGVSAILTFSMDTREAASIFSINAGGEFNAFGMGGGFNTKVKDTFMRAFQERRVKIDIKSYGGAPIDFNPAAVLQAQNFERVETEVGKLVANAVAKLEPSQAVDKRFHLTRFADLTVTNRRDLWRQEQEQKLRQLAESYDRVSAQVQRLDNHLDARVGTGFQVPSVDQRVELKRIRDKLLGYREYIATAHKALIEGSTAMPNASEPLLTASEMEAFWTFVSTKTPYEELNDRLKLLESKVNSTPRVVWMRVPVKATISDGTDRRNNPVSRDFSVDLKAHSSKPNKVLSAEAIVISSDLKYIEPDGTPDDHYIMQKTTGTLDIAISGTTVSGKYHALMRDDGANFGKGNVELLVISLVQD